MQGGVKGSARDPNAKSSKSFANSARIENWNKRQLSLFSKPPAQKKLNYLFYVILDNLCALPVEDGIPHPQQRHGLHVPIFPHPPVVGIESFRSLIRFLSGMGDFGRVNANRPRWKSFPGLREYEDHIRACLLCWARSRKLVEDSE